MPALLLLAALLAAEPARPGPDEAKKKVCRPAAPAIGSHIKRSRICRTAAEWDELDSSRRGADIPIKPAQPNPWDRTRPQ